MIREKLFLLLVFLLLAPTFFSIYKVRVSADPLFPCIMVVPDVTVDPTLTPGMNYTIAIYTSYNGSDIWGWQFGLTFDPAVLEGIEVLNGDLITRQKNTTARFIPGEFNNTLGTLSLTTAFFYPVPTPPEVTSGPGTLAYVNFRVVGIGISNLTLASADPDTAKLLGWGYLIITADGAPGATEPPYGSDHIGHGSFNNLIEGHEVAVRDIALPTTAIVGDNVTIDVTVANEGSYSETFNLTVTANATQVGNQTITDLTSGEVETLSFTWNTTNITAGNYVINATALVADMDPSDNNRTAMIEIRTLHDIAIVNFQTPAEAIAGDPVTINVTIANQGTSEEDVNLTITYQPNVPMPPQPAVINTTILQLAKRPTSLTISAIWNTTGIVKGTYRINATVTVIQDEALSDNSQTAFVRLKWGHDLATTHVSANSSAFIGELVIIDVTVENLGSFEETFDVTVTYGPDKILISTKQVVSLATENSATVSFTWDTTGLAANLYTVNATALLTTDVDLANNYALDTVVLAIPIGHIAGAVEDTSTGDIIEGVQVSAGGYSDVTDVNGRYNITNVPTGTYTVTASKSGFQTSLKTGVNVVSRQTTNLDFTLTPLSTSGNITGTVTDADGNPVEGANVTVTGYYDVTDENGQYTIANVPAGTYTVTASKDGYESSSNTNIVVTTGQTTILDIELVPARQDITMYVAIAVIVIIVIVGIAVYLRKTRKAK